MSCLCSQDIIVICSFPAFYVILTQENPHFAVFTNRPIEGTISDGGAAAQSTTLRRAHGDLLIKLLEST